MPGAWELQAGGASVLACVLSVDTCTVAWAFGVRNLIVPNGGIMAVAGMPYDHARNHACMRALDAGASHLFFLDSDVIPPPDAILRLLEHDVGVVSGVYCRRSRPHGIPVIQKNGTWVTELPKDRLFEADLVGAGCLLIRRDVLQALPPIDPQRGKHWFDWRVDMKNIVPQGEALSEDFSFNLHCRKHGIPILVDPTVMCKHVGYAQAGHGTFDPLEY